MKATKKKTNDKINPRKFNRNPRVANSLEQLVDQDLQLCKWAFEGGNFGGLQDAVLICEKHFLPLPEWANKAMYALIRDNVYKNIPKTIGRHSKWIKQYKQDMIDFIRADTVSDCIEHAIKWDDVYGVASEFLKGSFAEGSESAIEKSYKRYRQRVKENPERYVILRTIQFNNLHPSSKSADIYKYIESLRRK